MKRTTAVAAVSMLAMSAVLSISSRGLAQSVPPGAEQRLEPPPESEFSRYFGANVATDGETVAVTAIPGPHETGGAVHVYQRADGTWTRQARLTEPGRGSASGFGQSVSIDGDTLLVGAPWRGPDETTAQGRVYVFEREGDSWAHRQSFGAPGDSEARNFGADLALRGRTAIVGATRIQEVYVLHRADGEWSISEKIRPPEGEESPQYGRVVALAGDRLMVGAPRGAFANHDGPSPVFAYRHDGDAWSYEQTLSPANIHIRKRFGAEIALSSRTALIRVRALNSGMPGSAFVFRREDSNWQRVREITPPATEEDSFASSVALDGPRAYVSANRPSDGGPGDLYRYLRSDDWSAPTQFRSSESKDYDRFGASVAADGGLLVVGAASRSSGPGGEGAAYIYSDRPDADGDGVFDDRDNCPMAENTGQLDGDGDGTGDVCDACPEDPDHVEPGRCGCDSRPGGGDAGTGRCAGGGDAGPGGDAAPGRGDDTGLDWGAGNSAGGSGCGCRSTDAGPSGGVLPASLVLLGLLAVRAREA